MSTFAKRPVALSSLLAFALVALSGCSTFPLKYQNYLSKNFAYFASNYDGNPNIGLSSGAESNNFEDGNLDSYPAQKFPSVIIGFRTLEHHNTSGGYTSYNGDAQFSAFLVPPGKAEADAVKLATFDLKGTNLSSQGHIPEISKIVLIKMSYPAPMIYVDNAALQKKYGTGAYTVIWKKLRDAGKAENRELDRVTTTLN